MAKNYFIIHTNAELRVFDAQTELKQFLQAVEQGNSHASESTRLVVKKKLNAIVEGRIDEMFPDKSYNRIGQIGNVTVFFGVSSLG